MLCVGEALGLQPQVLTEGVQTGSHLERKSKYAHPTTQQHAPECVCVCVYPKEIMPKDHKGACHTIYENSKEAHKIIHILQKHIFKKDTHYTHQDRYLGGKRKKGAGMEMRVTKEIKLEKSFEQISHENVTALITMTKAEREQEGPRDALKGPYSDMPSVIASGGSARNIPKQLHGKQPNRKAKY